MRSSQNNMTTQLEAILQKNEESMQKAMEKVLGKMHDKIKRHIASLKEQHVMEAEQNRSEIQVLQDLLVARNGDLMRIKKMLSIDKMDKGQSI